MVDLVQSCPITGLQLGLFVTQQFLMCLLFFMFMWVYVGTACLLTINTESDESKQQNDTKTSEATSQLQILMSAFWFLIRHGCYWG